MTKKTTKSSTKTHVTAREFVRRLQAMQSDAEKKKLERYFVSDDKYSRGDKFMGVRMGNLFALAKEFIAMEPAEIVKLMESPVHEVRAGAMSIMDKQGRDNKTTEERRKELYDLYLSRHDRVNNWDLVDLGAPFVIGRYVFDKPRTILHTLAKSKNPWERRTAIVSTAYFIRQGDVGDTFIIAELLAHDSHDLVQKAVGGWIREAGKQDQKKLLAFLDKHAKKTPRTLLRYAIEHLSPRQREHYMKLKDS